jgi:hypothetical protein
MASLRVQSIGAIACCIILCYPAVREPAYGEPSEVLNLRCINPSANYNYRRNGENLARDSEQQEIRNAFFVAIKAKLPRLSVNTDGCPNRLSLVFSIFEFSPNQSFAGDARLFLHRQAVILDSKQTQSVETWTSIYQFWGPTRLLKQKELELMESLVNAFAADYYNAGNP